MLPLATGLYAPKPIEFTAADTQQDRWAQPLEITPETRLALLRGGKVQLAPEAKTPSAQEWHAEQQAHQVGLGLWADACCQLLTAADDIAPLQWRVVQGKVHSVSVRREAVFINFSENWKRDFTLIVPKGLAKKLKAETLKGQTITARGWVESYYGPAIRITAVAQIQLPSAAKSRTNNP